MDDDNKDAVEQSINSIEDEEVSEQPEGLSLPEESEQKANPNHPLRHKLAQFVKSGWGRALIVTVLVLGTALAVPMTRYALLGVFIKKQTTITVVDETTGKPVSDAVVHFARADGTTDKQGVITLDISVGDHVLSVEKKYYETASTSYTVPIFGGAATTVKLKATGRLATITVTNAISGKGVAGAAVKIGDTSALTDDSGAASVALPIRDADQPGTVILDGYTEAAISVSTKDISPEVAVQLVPSGKVYFLSNRSGTYDIMSSALDGSGQEVVVKGTGREVPYELQLAVSPTRETLAFVSRRDDKLALYMVDAGAKELAKVSEGVTSFSFVGWANDTFYYTTYTDSNPVTAGRTKLMSYDRSTKKTTQIDSSQVATGQATTLELSFSQPVLAGGRLYYARCWQGTAYYTGDISQKASIVTVVDGKVVVLKTADQTKPAYCTAFVKKPNLLYFNIASTYNGADSQYFRYQVGGSVETAQLSEADFMSPVTYLSSPNGSKTFWTETRDGKQVSVVGDANGDNGRQTGGGDTFRAYGWFGNEYVLYSKNNNELYIISADGQGDMRKIANYYSGQAQAY